MFHVKQSGGFGLYLHWPFCASKCPYCDFNSHVVTSIDQNAWKSAYLAEIERAGAETAGRRLDTVFFGGGTPSLMDPDLVSAIIDKIRRSWPMRNDPEITLEANPSSIEAGRFHGFQQAGVTRISMGMQAMNDVDLKRLGRLHTAREAMDAFDIARKYFDRVNFDLIYARQDQTLAEWRVELSQALSLAVDHLSLYQLTVEDGTAFGDRFQAGKLGGLPDDDTSADMYALTQEVTTKHGMLGYEISNHAALGAESQHNLIYWRGGDYIGIGPGAHGRLTLGDQRWATECPKSPQIWLEMVRTRQNGEMPRSLLDRDEVALEYMMMSMRLREGMDLARYEDISGHQLNAETIQHLTEIGKLRITENRLIATDDGRVVLNAVLRALND
jgi:putative oxygen-independent coproporphyrinogen III oxidase